MKNVRRFAKNPVLLILLCCSVLFVSCKTRNPGQTTQQTNKVPYSGEELFRGIFFLEGEVANKIPEIRNLKKISGFNKISDYKKDLLEKTRSRIVSEIKKDHPDFFPNFAKTLQSGDRVKIQQTLIEVDKLVFQQFSKKEDALSNIYKNFQTQELQTKAKNTLSSTHVKNIDISNASRADFERMLEAENTGFLELRDEIYRGFEEIDPPPVDIDCFGGLECLGMSKDDFIQQDGENVWLALVVVLVVLVAILLAAPIRGDLQDPGNLFQDQLVNSIAGGLDWPYPWPPYPWPEQGEGGN